MAFSETINGFFGVSGGSISAKDDQLDRFPKSNDVELQKLEENIRLALMVPLEQRANRSVRVTQARRGS